MYVSEPQPICGAFLHIVLYWCEPNLKPRLSIDWTDCGKVFNFASQKYSGILTTNPDSYLPTEFQWNWRDFLLCIHCHVDSVVCETSLTHSGPHGTGPELLEVPGEKMWGCYPTAAIGASTDPAFSNLGGIAPRSLFGVLRSSARFSTWKLCK